MGSAGFEPTTSSAQGWHHTMLDNDPRFLAKSTIHQHNFKLRYINNSIYHHFQRFSIDEYF